MSNQSPIKNAYQFAPPKILFCHSVEKQEVGYLVNLASTLQKALRWNTSRII